jgi:hypothetical protein
MAAFWDWRTTSTANIATAPAPTDAPQPTLEPVEVYTATAMVHGLVEPEGRRLSDILNSNSVLAIRNARSTSLVADVDGAEGTGWSRLPTDDILFVMPPPRVSPRQMRINRRQHRVRIETGQFQIVGNAHVLPGVRLDPYVLRTRMHFLAVTDAHVSSLGDPAWERSASVVLVNVRPVAGLREVLTIS